MRACGDCTLCCKIPRIPVLKKPSNVWCKFCSDNGCSIHATSKPQVCKDFTCWWLTGLMPEEMRPDKVHLYVSGNAGDEVIKILVDTDYPNAWKEAGGDEVVDLFIRNGFHVLVVVGNQVTFLPGAGRVKPEKILLDWLL
jgi:hypothetical protein